MMAGPLGPGEPPWQDEPAGRQASLAALWALALDRFRDYLHWATGAWVSEAADDHQERGAVRDPRHDRGETHDPER